MVPPVISVLLPARGRPSYLHASVESLFRLASCPAAVEVLVRLDTDDRTLHDCMRALRAAENEQRIESGQVRVEIAPRVGYAQMHTMYEGCAARARGEWLLFWNDDITMVTDGWDRLLAECPSFAVQFPRRDITPTTDFTLPCLGRGVYEAMGRRLSRNAYCDAWIVDVAAHAGVAVARDDIEFVHHRLGDETLRDQADHQPREWAKFQTPEQRDERLRDLAKVLAAPAYSSRWDGWAADERPIGIDYVNLAPELAPRAYLLRGRA